MTKEWKKYQATILGLYKGQGKTLNEVMKIMETQYGFKASTRAYRARFDRWDVRKYNKSGRKLSTMTMPARLPSSVATARMFPSTKDSRSPSFPAPMMIRSYSGPPLSASPYSPDLSYAQLKTDPYAASASPGSSTSSHNPIDLHKRLMHHQYYAQPVQQHLHHVPIDGYADISHRFPGFGHHPPTSIRDHHFLSSDSHLRQNSSDPDDYVGCISAFRTILENPMPPSQDPQRVQLFLMYIQRLAHQPQLNERRAGGLNALELYIQNFLSRDGIRDFCQIAASFICAGADTSRVVPKGFSHTVCSASRNGMLTDIDEVLREQQQQRGLCIVPTCAVVWASACVENLKGRFAAANTHLSVLPFKVSEYCEVDIPVLSGLLPVKGDIVVPPICPELDTDHKARVDHASTR